MNPTEIYDALAQISTEPFDAVEFPFAFAAATDAAQSAISKLRNGSTNKSDISGGVLFGKRFHYAPAQAGQSDIALDQLRASKKTKTSKPAILLATDGEMIAAEHLASGDTLHCTFAELGDQFGFFLPAAGKERYRAVEENPVDVKATGKLARLYDALIRTNPAWGSDDRRHEMNQLMMRLIFCMFAEDVGIFPENQFSRLIFTFAGDKGEEAHKAIISAFQAMNLPKRQRATLPAWTHDLEYVNGGLFAGTIDAPIFDIVAFRYLREACGLNWREINPDIFGSMIQSVADPKQRAELGMHYTSVPNIMKVIGPLFLDGLDAEIEKGWDRARALQKTLEHLSRIRVFDPACGSGNFLVVSYRELRAREMRIMQRLEALNGSNAMGTHEMFSHIKIDHFYGIEISDFAAETAKLALFIAEYQANVSFKAVFGRCPAALPLRDAARIRTGNALRLNWQEVCPLPTVNEDVFIVSNPPFVGTTYRSTLQKKDFKTVFEGRVKSPGRLDFSACWMLLASNYIRGSRAKSALITTSSTVQGSAISTLWKVALSSPIKIFFSHRPFKWKNNASKNAAVECVIVGLSSQREDFSYIYDGEHRKKCSHINAYLLDGSDIFIGSRRESIFGLPSMGPGNFPYDFGHLILSPEEKKSFIASNSAAKSFLFKFVGSREVIHDIDRYCLWIDDCDLERAQLVSEINERIQRVFIDRSSSSDAGTNRLSSRPHQFREHNAPKHHMILVPRTSSERRDYLPVARASGRVISSDNNQVLYDAPEWCIALIASRLHLVWIATVCGRLESRFRYSSTMGWNTFPVPKFTEDQLDSLSESARRILKCRYSHYPKTIADLYDPDKMPDDLRAVHRENDELLESMYIGRPFRNDTERLEKLFKLYAAKVKTLEAASKKKTAPKKRPAKKTLKNAKEA